MKAATATLADVASDAGPPHDRFVGQSSRSASGGFRNVMPARLSRAFPADLAGPAFQLRATEHVARSARSQGVAMLANAFHDEKFIKREVKQMCDWLSSCTENAARRARDAHGAGEPDGRRVGRKPKRADRRPALSVG